MKKAPSGKKKPTQAEHRRHNFAPALAMGPERQGFRIVGRLWIEHDEQTAISMARATLLELIKTHGSISSAARSMGISYAKAHRMVKEMNLWFDTILVDRSVGGVTGGGAILTEKGEAVVARFKMLVEDFNRWMADQDFRV
ncbi:MAG: LysR family transcriptional regulator [Myxococcota bacterium]|jgi:molybdate transport system regulatory protein